MKFNAARGVTPPAAASWVVPFGASMVSNACWYLSATTLAGLTLNAVFGLWWADLVAALVIVVVLVREGVEALRGEDEG